MQKYRLHLMIAVCIALAALVWLDNRELGRASDQSTQNAASGEPQRESGSMEAADLATSSPESDPSIGLTIGNPLASIRKDWLRDTVERPLLAPSRRRPETQTAKNPSFTANDGPQSYELLGVLMNGDRAIALLRKAGGGASFRVEMGDMVGGWRVAKVETRSVLLERSDGTSLAVPLDR